MIIVDGQIAAALDQGKATTVKVPVRITPFGPLRRMMQVDHVSTCRGADEVGVIHPRFRSPLEVTAQNRYLAVAGHVEHMSRLAEATAVQLGYTAKQACAIRSAASLHDIGKIAIPDRILLKPGRLDSDERRIMQLHTIIGYELLSGSDDAFLDLAASIALSHHERWDGTGYPNGLSEDEIPLEARVASVADVFDALTRPRAYRGPVAPIEALRMVVAGRGTQFDSHVVDAFLATTQMRAVMRETEPSGEPSASRLDDRSDSGAHAEACQDRGDVIAYRRSRDV